MSCERYKALMVEAAAAGEVAPRLRWHLEACAECRAAFAREQTLLSAVDASLSQRMKVSPSAEFLPRVRSAIDLEKSDWPVRTANVWFRWLPIAGTAAALCLALLFAVRHPSLAPERQQPVANALAPEAAETQVHPQQLQPEPESAALAMASPLQRPAKRQLRARADRTALPPEILVPSGERVALAQFVAGLSRRREVALALARPTPFEPQPETSPVPLEIARLEVPSLVPVKEK
jgi:hypothetical protein